MLVCIGASWFLESFIHKQTGSSPRSCRIDAEGGREYRCNREPANRGTGMVNRPSRLDGWTVSRLVVDRPADSPTGWPVSWFGWLGWPVGRSG